MKFELPEINKISFETEGFAANIGEAPSISVNGSTQLG